VAAAKTKKLSFISAGFTSLPDVILIGSELQGMIFSFVYFLLFLPTSEINLATKLEETVFAAQLPECSAGGWHFGFEKVELG
jgi:hypothetical protein